VLAPGRFNGRMARPRRFELAAALGRLRCGQMRSTMARAPTTAPHVVPVASSSSTGPAVGGGGSALADDGSSTPMDSET